MAQFGVEHRMTYEAILDLGLFEPLQEVFDLRVLQLALAKGGQHLVEFSAFRF